MQVGGFKSGMHCVVVRATSPCPRYAGGAILIIIELEESPTRF
jgi:hypothetical protein